MRTVCKGINLGLAIGIVWGFSVLLTGLVAMHFHYGVELVRLMGTIYIGYKATVVGSLIGGLYGLVDGFIFGFLVGAIYHLLSKFHKYCSYCCACKTCGNVKCECGIKKKK